MATKSPPDGLDDRRVRRRLESVSGSRGSNVAVMLSALHKDPKASSRLIWALSIPVLAQNLLGMFVGWSDTILTGRLLGEVHLLAAVTVSGYLLWLIETSGTFVSKGTEAIVARLVGAEEFDDAAAMTLQSLLLGFLVGLGVMLVVWGSAETVIGWILPDELARGPAVEYLVIAGSSCPMMLLLRVGVGALRAAGYTIAGMWIITIVNVVNIAASWILATGLGPIPAFGWAGVAAGTATAYVVGGLVTLAWLVRGEGRLRVPLRIPKPDLAVFRRILNIGVPGGVNGMSVVVCQLWYLSIISGLGNAAIAAHGVAIRGESVSWLMADAMSVAAATLVGQSLGARRPDLARQYGWAVFGYGAVLLSLFGVGFVLGAPLIFALFTPPEMTDSVRALGVPVLQLIALGMPALAATIILTRALQGAGDTRWPLLYDAAGFLLVRIPLAYLFTSAAVGLGLLGAWLAMLIDLYFRGTCATLRYHFGDWAKTRV
ncbi:Multidrug resistance protein MdtK [Planctomycetes bacterium Pan216]|uniref:Multidrug-efflux transporter n=1 Tax=Kolteria novifilia TaxID=2527975 RepID=A0A518BB50_9BACT|nr:Multidrug resistance protein MdtK [Planctomycetes bacterium Pan216]